MTKIIKLFPDSTENSKPRSKLRRACNVVLALPAALVSVAVLPVLFASFVIYGSASFVICHLLGSHPLKMSMQIGKTGD